MRFADRPSQEVEVRIAAPPERVWPVLTDLARFGAWSPENEGGTWLDAGGPAVGARFRGRQSHRAVGTWETTSTVTECDPPRRFTWVVGPNAEEAGASWSFELAPDADGTRVRFRAVMGPGPSGTTAAIERMPDKEERIIERRLQEWDAGMRAVLEGVRAEVEATAAG
jgi:uncharacterized protein YndB with AHSA1/START domain